MPVESVSVPFNNHGVTTSYRFASDFFMYL